jgi:hypothetical protein
MRPWLLVLAVLCAALAAVGCEERLRPGFPHRAHLLAEGCGEPGQPPCPSCATCHDAIRLDDARALPTSDDCARCHRERTAEVVAAVRHQTQKRTPIVFDHRQHLNLESITGQCVGCHAGVAVDGVNGDVFPPMATCTDCHEGSLERGECAPCHRAEDMQKLVPETFLRHDLNFLRDHGMEATRYGSTCSQCHAERQCAACHDTVQTLGLATRLPTAIERDLIHRADFETRHAIDARSQPAKCLRCHQVNECDSCHIARGVSGNGFGARNPHPIGWVGSGALGNHHGRAARRDILSCATCHERGPATNCIRCHKVGGNGGNPHPSGWRSVRSVGDAMCRYCHEP